jgi:DNA repair exonuclease SbcCD ATPase subunit
MKLKSLELNEFQKHQHLLLNFTDGVNTVIGATDCGKSTIIRAIRWVLYPSELRGDVVRRDGSKKTSVAMTLDDGVIIERIKTATVNSYKLTVSGETKEYNATGNDLPEDIQKIIKVAPIEVEKEKIILNIANQLALPFLLDKSGTFRQKLFNKLTGNDILDQAMQGLNKDILQTGRDEKAVLAQLEEQKASLINVKKQKEVALNIEKLFNEQLNKIQVLNSRLDTLQECQQKFVKVNDQLYKTREQIKSIKEIPAELIKILKQKVNKYDNYLTLAKEINKVNKELKEVKNKVSKIILPSVDTKELKKKIDYLQKLNDLKAKLNNVIISLHPIAPKIEEYELIISKKENERVEILKSIRICPFFHKECPLQKELK